MTIPEPTRYHHIENMEKAGSGDWVMYSDYAALAAAPGKAFAERLERAEAALREIVNALER